MEKSLLSDDLHTWVGNKKELSCAVLQIYLSTMDSTLKNAMELVQLRSMKKYGSNLRFNLGKMHKVVHPYTKSNIMHNKRKNPKGEGHISHHGTVYLHHLHSGKWVVSYTCSVGGLCQNQNCCLELQE